MKVITLKTVLKQKATIYGQTYDLSFNPGERYIIDDYSYAQLYNTQKDKIWDYSDLAPYLGKVRPTDWRGKRVLFYRSRGLGDELMLTAIVRYFREVLGAETYVAVNQSHRAIWASDYGFSDSLATYPISMPIHLDSVWKAKGPSFYDYTFFIESVSEFDGDQEQPNVYDRMFELVGLDPFNIPDRYKRPYLPLSGHDKEEWQKFKVSIRNHYPTLNLEGGYIVWQDNAQNAIRNIPELKKIQILQELAKTGRQVITINDKLINVPAGEFFSLYFTDLRVLWSLLSNAKLVAGPDSLLIHAAEGLGVPNLGFFGPVSPDSRVRYYANHKSIWHHDTCNSSPCFHFEKEMPFHKCPRGKEQKTCEVFEGINGEEIRKLLENGAAFKWGGMGRNRGLRSDASLTVASQAEDQTSAVPQLS